MKKIFAALMLSFVLFAPVAAEAAYRSSGGFRASPSRSYSAPRTSTRTTTPRTTAPRTYSAPSTSTYHGSSGVNTLLWMAVLGSSLSSNAQNAKTNEEIKALSRTYCTDNYDEATCAEACTDKKETGSKPVGFFQEEVTYTSTNVCNDTSSESTAKEMSTKGIVAIALGASALLLAGFFALSRM